MLDPLKCKRGDLVVCVNDRYEHDPQDKFRHIRVGGIYIIRMIQSDEDFRRNNQIALTTPAYGIKTPYIVHLELMPMTWGFGLWRFSPVEEYQTVIKLYRDLIINPPRNKGDAGSENV